MAKAIRKHSKYLNPVPKQIHPCPRSDSPRIRIRFVSATNQVDPVLTRLTQSQVNESFQKSELPCPKSYSSSSQIEFTPGQDRFTRSQIDSPFLESDSRLSQTLFECIKSKVQDRIWVPDSNQDDSLNEDASSQNLDQSQSALSLLSRPLKALPPPLNGPYPSTSTQKQRKFENNKRAASPSGTEILLRRFCYIFSSKN